MEKLSALEKKYIIIEEKLKEQATFYMEDVQALFPDMKQSSIYWNLSKLVEAGYLKRVRAGVYAFNEWKGKTKIALTDDIKKVQEILDESGFDYFISGLDVLQRFMQHVPEQYPMILFVEKSAHEEMVSYLMNGGYPLSLQELVRVYQNLVRLGNIDKKKMITVSTKRNLQSDIRLIVETPYITDEAMQFAAIL